MSNITIYRNPVALRANIAKIEGVLDSLTLPEREIFRASLNPTFGDMESGAMAVQMRKALATIANDVGVKGGEEERARLLVRLCGILKTYYPELSVPEFYKAFDLLQIGQLGEINHFQNFNIDYICRVLNAYKGKRLEVLKKVYDRAPKPKEKTIDENEVRMLHLQTIEDCYTTFDTFKETGTLPNISPIAEMLYYNLLSGAGLVEKVEVSEEERKYILQKTINDYAKVGRGYEVRRLEREGHTAQEVQHSTYIFARKKAIKEAFRKLVNEGKDIRDFVKIDG